MPSIGQGMKKMKEKRAGGRLKKNSLIIEGKIGRDRERVAMLELEGSVTCCVFV
jgi:hypothetical protein